MKKKCFQQLIGLVLLSFFVQVVEGADRAPKFRPTSSSNASPRIEKYRYTQSGTKSSFSSLQEDRNFDASITKKNKNLTTKNQNTFWNRFDEMDRQIFITTLPLSAIFAIIPLASTIDLFWVNRLGNTLAVAGQAAANQVYGSAFWLFSFLPSVTATLVSKTHANGDLEGTQDAVCQALFFAVLISAVGAKFMFSFPAKALGSILKGKFLYSNVVTFVQHIFFDCETLYALTRRSFLFFFSLSPLLHS